MVIVTAVDAYMILAVSLFQQRAASDEQMVTEICDTFCYHVFALSTLHHLTVIVIATDAYMILVVLLFQKADGRDPVMTFYPVQTAVLPPCVLHPAAELTIRLLQMNSFSQQMMFELYCCCHYHCFSLYAQPARFQLLHIQQQATNDNTAGQLLS